MKRSTAINCGIVAAAIVAGSYASLRPWQAFREQRADTDRQVSEMRASERRRADLLKQEAHAKSFIGHEEGARALGYVTPGERADKP